MSEASRLRRAASSSFPSLRIIGCALGVSWSEALQGLFWLLRGKRVRGRNHLIALASRSPAYYQLWIREAEPRPMVRTRAGPSAPGKGIRLVVGILDDARASAADRAATSRSAEQAAHRARAAADIGVDLCPTWASAGSAGACRTDLTDLAHERTWVVPLVAGDVIPSSAFLSLGAALSADSGAGLVFWDEDELEGTARHAPWVKGGFDPVLFLGRDGMVGACAIRADIFAQLAMPDGALPTKSEQLFAALVKALALGKPAFRIEHIPGIFTHRASGIGALPAADRAGIIASVLHERTEIAAAAANDIPGLVRLRLPLGAPAPSVAIVIPTRDRADLLRACLAGLTRLNYPGDVRIVIVDNNSTEPDALSYLGALARQGVTVLRDQGPFNFARLNNRAVAACEADFVCLLNNDVEALDGDWLSAMIGWAMQPEVGCAGALLLYPDGRVQHAGVEIGVGGAAGHAHRLVGFDDRGHAWLHRTTQSVSAVTAACLVVRRASYLAVGGLDEDRFAVAFNDVDFCLRIQAKGLRNVLVAEARLVHHESLSRKSDFLPENIDRFSKELAALQEGWSTATATDPHRSPLLARQSERHVLAV